MVIDDLIEIAEKERAARKKYAHPLLHGGGLHVVRLRRASRRRLDKAVKEAGLEEQVEVRGVGCMKLCCQGPLVQVDSARRGRDGRVARTAGTALPKVTPEDAASLIGTLKGGKTKVQAATRSIRSSPSRLSIVLANSGIVDPERIESYIAADGYQALHDVLREMTPEGGAGRDDQERAARARRRGLSDRPQVGHGRQDRASQQKYVICNADEGDPGAFMDRSVLESDPHSVLEGMAIAAYAVGAEPGLHLRARRSIRWPSAGCRRPSSRPKQQGLLGSGIFESPLQLQHRPAHRRRRVRLRRGDGADGLGRRQARHAAAAPAVPGGERPVGLPDADQQRRDVRQRRRRSSARAADWFAGIGTEKSKGTKVFALAGKITNTGLIEVPMGTPLRQIVDDMGGGVPGRRQDQGRADGRPVGRLHPGRGARHAGGLRVADQARLHHGLGRHDRDGRDHLHGGRGPVLHGVLHGRIVRQVHPLPGRHGADARAARRRSRAGKATRRRPARSSRSSATWCKSTSLCGLGQTAPNPVLSTLRFFRDEYTGAHRRGAACPAGRLQDPSRRRGGPAR